MKQYLVAISLLLLSTTAFSQTKPTFKAINQSVDLSLATNGDLSSVAVSVNRLHGLGQSKRFRIGYGLRFTSVFGSKVEYSTAPASLISESSSIGSLFAETIDANIDTLTLGSAQVNALNASIYLEYGLSSRFDVGFNIDAIGFSFGGKQTGTFQANLPTRSSLSGTSQMASPTSLNVLLIGASDRGSLNSEFYARYRLTDTFSLKGGIAYQFTEFTTNRKLTLDNDRFRNSSAMIMVGAAYQF